MSFWNNIRITLDCLTKHLSDMYSSWRQNTPLGRLYDMSSSGGLLESATGKFLGTNLTGAEREANFFNAEEAQKQRDWEEYMASTVKQREVADYKAAGLNPMMAAGGSGSVPSGASASSVSPSVGSLSDLFSLATLKPTIDKLKADKANVEADTALKAEEAINKKEDTRGKQLANEFNELTINSRKEAIELENNLKSAQYRLVYKKMDEIEASMTKIIEEAHTEQEKQAVLKCEAWLKSAEAKQIIEMLPYNKALAEAKTDEARAAAQLSRMHAAYQQKLLDSDYLDNIIRKAEADADSAEAKAALAKIKTAIRTGNTGDLPQLSFWEGLFTGRGAMSNIANFLDNFNPLNGLLGG